jgi:hypothetical protein
VNEEGKLRIRVEDQQLASLDLSVTDVRFYQNERNSWLLMNDVATKVQQRISVSRPSELLLAVGLARELDGVHWLQVNNIFFEKEPFWS